MNKEDLVIDNIYKLNKHNGGNSFIFLFKGIAGHKIFASSIINIEACEYDREKLVCLVNIESIDRIVIPTNNEMDWLVKCKNANKFVKRPKVEFDLLQFQNVVDNDIFGNDEPIPMLEEDLLWDGDHEIQKPMDGSPLEVVLEYCKIMYPIGTTYKSYHPNKVYTVQNEPRIEGIIEKGIGDGCHYNGWIYNGKYAQIVNPIEHQLQNIHNPVEIDFINLYSLKELQDAFANEDYDDDVFEQIMSVIKSIKE